MKKLIVASNNKKKIEEIKSVLNEVDLEVRSLKEEGIDIDVVEDGLTFGANSRKKAVEIKEYLLKNGKNDFIVLADDSGLEVDYLNGEPGVFSARYSGTHGDDDANNKKLLEKLKNVKWEDRKAKFVCVITLINDLGKEIAVRGEVEGIITEKESGKAGFGYDPLFFIEEYNKTFSEMTGEEKNKISHRGKALEKIKSEIDKLI
ncbi:XTP/dITP diphosphatase [Clostridium massiliamazoniense]|uniref:XTP/dITP diphosphatase n=1 Tax=Clostridium massiliamazoniense TaxID=1347366 RepID=UPI0006D80231|nr:XTP/dITP diphosphatase [Clostridium massiliamazoniense]